MLHEWVSYSIIITADIHGVAQAVGTAFIKPDQLDPWTALLKITLLSPILPHVVTKYCEMWEDQAFPHVAKVCNCSCKKADTRALIFQVDSPSIDQADSV